MLHQTTPAPPGHRVSYPWVCARSRRHNQVYYYNQLTQQSQWHSPEPRRDIAADAELPETLMDLDEVDCNIVYEHLAGARQSWESNVGEGSSSASWAATTANLSRTSLYELEYLVVDTNILISSLPLLRRLLGLLRSPAASDTRPIPGANVVMVVPTAVLNELDGLKKGARAVPSASPAPATGPREAGVDLGLYARAAIRYLYTEMSRTAGRRIMGEGPFDYSQLGDAAGTNDDRVIQCAKRFSLDVATVPARALLLSEDKALLLKAKVLGVLCCTVAEVRDCLELPLSGRDGGEFGCLSPPPPPALQSPFGNDLALGATQVNVPAPGRPFSPPCLQQPQAPSSACTTMLVSNIPPFVTKEQVLHFFGPFDVRDVEFPSPDGLNHGYATAMFVRGHADAVAAKRELVNKQLAARTVSMVVVPSGVSALQLLVDQTELCKRFAASVSTGIVEVLTAVFGPSEWQSVVTISPPWSHSQLFQLIERHWSVLSQHWPLSLRPLFRRLKVLLGYDAKAMTDRASYDEAVAAICYVEQFVCREGDPTAAARAEPTSEPGAGDPRPVIENPGLLHRRLLQFRDNRPIATGDIAQLSPEFFVLNVKQTLEHLLGLFNDVVPAGSGCDASAKRIMWFYAEHARRLAGAMRDAATAPVVAPNCFSLAQAMEGFLYTYTNTLPLENSAGPDSMALGWQDWITKPSSSEHCVAGEVAFLERHVRRTDDYLAGLFCS